MNYYCLRQNIIPILVVLCVSLLSTYSSGECSGPVSNAAMVKPSYWIDKMTNPNEIVMPENQIRKYNQAIQNAMTDTVVDLQNYPQTLDKKRLTLLLTATSFPKEEAYSNGKPISASFYDDLRLQMDLSGIRDVNLVRYGFTVVRANLRTFPTNKAVFETEYDWEFDLFQETAVDPAASLIILHQSLSKDWFYVQTNNYRGWIPAANVAIAATKKEWIDYMNKSKFLVVTGSALQIRSSSNNNQMLIFEMGAKLPLVPSNGTAQKTAGDLVLLPARDQYGKLYFNRIEIPRSADVHVGYLPYTKANVIRQAFKFYGQPYGWGGMHNSVDCSSLVMNVYRSVGILLPRNADQQEVDVGKVLRVKNAGYAAIEKKLMLLQPGATLHMDGHVMLYVGREQNKFYIIHSLGSYGDINRPNGDGTLGRIGVMKVILSDLDMTRRNGKTFMESLTVAKNITQ